MFNVLVFALVGLGAQLVDGALGMAFGVTATTLLMFSGVGAAQASAAVHLAEVGTTLASGISHWRFRNVDRRLVLALGVPGAIGAFLGASVLARLSTAAAVPVTSAVLLAIGIYVLLRFSLRPPDTTMSGPGRAAPHRARFLAPLGLFGGFVDATGGGGWGPVTSSALLSRGRDAPRTVIGSVTASEFLVAAAASLGFLFGLHGQLVANLAVVAGLSIGGVIAAPVAAWLVSRLPATILGTSVGGVIVLTNTQKLLGTQSLPHGVAAAVYLLIVCVWSALLVVAWRRGRAVDGAPPSEVDTVADESPTVDSMLGLPEVEGAAGGPRRTA